MTSPQPAWLKGCICKRDDPAPDGAMWMSISCTVHGFSSTYEVKPMTITAAVRKATTPWRGGIRFDAAER